MTSDDNPLAAAMLEQRRIMISGAFDDLAVASASTQLMYLDGLSGDLVNLVINAAGPSIDAALPLIDTLSLMRAPVTVDVLGRAEGAAGVVVATAPGLRRMGAMATLSLRIDSPRGSGSADELRRLAALHRSTSERVVALVAARSGQELPWVADQLRAGGFFDAKAAVESGLVDERR